jgi:ribonuclease BN (tRNA processing enzyme)
MKCKILGCGNAFSKINYNQCFMLEENGKKMLIDYGAKAPQALENAGENIFDIDAIYISHQHADHIGGLEEAAFTRYDWMNRPERFDDYTKLENVGNMKPYAPKLFAQKELLKNLWKKSLSGGLESMEGFDATLATFFEPKPVDKSFTWEGWNFELIQQVHIMTGSKISPTFGLIVSKEVHL